ncbi:MAG: hypothetical protein Sapg2KO_26560 [Saprospiraceae bacterium]
MEPIKLLIVEDDPIIAADLERAMKKMAYQVTGAVESGEEALAIIEQTIPDIILMDIQLEGDLDGVDTAHLISKKYPIPIIFLTSNTDDRTFNRAKLTQPHGFLSKPFRFTDIKHSIDLAFTAHKPSPEALQKKELESRTFALEDSIFVKSKEHLVKIKLEEILYVEADSCYCSIKTSTGSYMIVSTLKKFVNSVKSENLLRIHRSYLINMDKIDKIGDAYVLIKEKMIPIGRSYRTLLFQKVHKL